MANGTHWEWRGFGRSEDEFHRAFERYPLAYQTEWDTPTDEYIWIPGCPINVKLRSGGTQEGVKLKRFVRREGDLELWFEDPTELFPYASLDAALLHKVAALVGITISTIPASAPSRETVLEAFRHASPVPSVVTIKKERQTRRNGDILIEFARIVKVEASHGTVTADTPPHSVAIENKTDLSGAQPAGLDSARDAVDAIVNALHLRRSSLRPMNYLQAIDAWLSMPFGVRVTF